MDTSTDMIEQVRELAKRDGIDTTAVRLSIEISPKFKSWEPISIDVRVESKDGLDFDWLGGSGHTVNEAWEEAIVKVRDYIEDGSWVVQR